MLQQLSVQNLALIEDVQVELEGGFSAWTGETGAGKSLLLTALGLVLGGKASSEFVRAGKSEARASAVFEIGDRVLREKLEAILGAIIEEDVLIITRRVSGQGRSMAQANGTPVTIGTLERLGALLVDIHGQHEGRALLDPDGQRALMDGFGKLEGPLEAYRTARAGHDALRRKRQQLLDATLARQRERALLEFERDELEAADPRTGEYDELMRQSHAMASAEAIRAAATEGYGLLYEADHSAQELLKRVARNLEPLAAAAPELADAAASLARLAGETREVAYTLRDLGEQWEDDPRRLEEIETRLALYRRLAGRFHCTPDALADRRVATAARLAAIARDEEDLGSLDVPLAQSFAALKKVAAKLSSARRKTAERFTTAIQGQLRSLGLEKSRISVEVESRELGADPAAAAAPESGLDSVEMLFLANPGESPRPLRKIASGGELSRVTLAAKTVLAGVDRVPTLIFDEIDTGVGGRLGSALGKALGALARHHQVVCITHLPQLASHAHHQWVIRKHVERGRTSTTITLLSDADRVHELALMLRGESAAEGTRQEALDMLREAQGAEKRATGTNGRVRRR